MSKLKWDQTGERLYELGIDHGVLYLHGSDPVAEPYANAYVWNGLTTVDESPEGGEQNDQWADNMKYVSITSAENFAGTINAFTYPDEFMVCDGSAEAVSGLYITGQSRQPFGFAYRTKIGNDVKGANYGYKLHLCYNMMAQPSDKSRETINDSPEATEFSWEFKTTPVNIETEKPDGSAYQPTAHLIIDSTQTDATLLKKLEDILYGTDATTNAEATVGRLPLPDEVISILSGADSNAVVNTPGQTGGGTTPAQSGGATGSGD